MEGKEITIIKLFMAKVKQSMKEQKITQKQLAKDLKMTEVHLSNVLTGKYNPGFEMLWHLYNYFNFDFNIFDVKSYE